MTADHLLQALDRARERARRIRLVEVWSAFYTCAPHLRGHPDARPELARHLTDLARAGALKLPRGTRLYDRAQSPPLPHWVELHGEQPSPSARARASTIAWHPALDFVRRLRRLSEREVDDLLCIQRFLAERGADEPMLTARERSLRLFGDEKRLERVADGPLFRAGLSYALLCCYPVRLPFVYRDFGNGDCALIIENKDTFHSACKARATSATSRTRYIIFGHGHTIHSSIESMLDFTDSPRRLLYFGDIDRRGLEIAQALEKIVRTLAPLPPLERATTLYTRLFERSRGFVAPAGGRCTLERARAIAAWLSTPLAEHALPILVNGQRLPQEWVTATDFAELLP